MGIADLRHAGGNRKKGRARSSLFKKSLCDPDVRKKELLQIYLREHGKLSLGGSGDALFLFS